jgi:glycosyltransferase involved in cell wall biosynthesis
MTVPDISLIICTHNPRTEYLSRVLGALRAQTLPLGQWELLVIDNASTQPLAGVLDLSWHPSGRVVREEETGLTPARLRGIAESIGRLLIFVDDDNVLDADYLCVAAELAKTFPQIGAFGGSIRAEFEVPPPSWIDSYIEGFAVCELDRDYWSNFGGWSLASPYGAGLCARREVASDYSAKVKNSPLRRMLDRTGTGMGAGGDSDLAWCATDAGLGTGRFYRLKMTHLIPKNRLTEDYVTRLNEGFAGSSVVMDAIRPGPRKSRGAILINRARALWKSLWSTTLQRRINAAASKARRKAEQQLAAMSRANKHLS